MVWVDERKAVIPLDAPDAFGAAAFEQGGVVRLLERGEVPERASVRDAFRYASGALRFDLELAPGAARELHLAVPFGAQEPARAEFGALRRLDGATQLASAATAWTERLGSLAIRVGEGAHPCVDALRTAAAHILINRDGAALQPGPRRYTRSWIRDGATMAAALLRMDRADAVRDFLRWYAPYQRADGNVPCAVDREGPDWLAEHDSHGELVVPRRRVLPLHGRPRAPRRAVAGGVARGRLPRVVARSAARRRIRIGRRGRRATASCPSR